PPHDSDTTLRRDDALSGGHPVPGRRRGPGTTGSGAADSCDSAAGDFRRDRRDASGASHWPLPPADLQAHRRVLRLARGLYGLARAAAYAGDGSGGDRPRDGSHSGPARRAPAPAEYPLNEGRADCFGRPTALCSTHPVSALGRRPRGLRLVEEVQQLSLGELSEGCVGTLGSQRRIASEAALALGARPERKRRYTRYSPL